MILLAVNLITILSQKVCKFHSFILFYYFYSFCKDNTFWNLHTFLGHYHRNNFTLYKLNAKDNVDIQKYIHDNFKEVIGKVYSPLKGQLYLALEKSRKEGDKEKEDEKLKEENTTLYAELEKSFIIEEYKLL